VRLILARHGNTFSPSDKVVWVGKSNDLPLVESGRTQAAIAAKALEKIRFDGVFSGPLQRAFEFATIISQKLNITAPVVDPRLDEIDYGNWSGLSDEEIRQRFGATELEAWNNRSVWPLNAGWSGEEEIVRQEVRAFIADLRASKADGTFLIVSSNGRLRYFLTLIDGAFEKAIKTAAFKMKTGYLSAISFPSGSTPEIEFWNIDPNHGLPT
jgi:broad specificity phosphatase PhoE